MYLKKQVKCRLGGLEFNVLGYKDLHIITTLGELPLCPRDRANCMTSATGTVQFANSAPMAA
jgi:hypothetical protein